MKKRIYYLSSIILVAILLAGASQIAISQYGANKPAAPTSGSSPTHFSVRWMGLAPDSNTTWPAIQPYSDNYTDYYICINDVISDKLSLPISFRLVNQESSAFYFRILQISAPAEWSTPPNELGLVEKDQTRFFTITTERTKPSSIPEGATSETITLTIQAYYDSSYTQFYSEDDVPVTFHFIDRTASVWSAISTENFDSSTESQWTAVGTYNDPAIVSGDLYRSWPNSLRLRCYAYDAGTGFGSTISINSSYVEAYLIASVKTSGWATVPKVTFDDITYFEPDVAPTQNSWHQLMFPLPVNQTTQVGIYFMGPWAYGNLDDVYVIAKAK